MMRVVMILVVAGVVAVGGCGRKNDPVKPSALLVVQENSFV